MKSLFQDILTYISHKCTQVNSFRKTLSSLWNGTPYPTSRTTEGQLKSILETHFPQATAIKVQDASEGSGEMYSIYIETKDFKGISIRNQHRAVYDALKDQIKLMHGLHVVTKVPKLP